MTPQPLPLRQEDDDCPDGTEYYICPVNLFSGCCSVDPCNNAACPEQNGPTTGTKDSKDAKSTTSRPEMTISSSINVPIITGSTEFSEVISTIIASSEGLATSTASQSLPASTDSANHTPTETSATPLSHSTAVSDPTGDDTQPPTKTAEGVAGGEGGLSAQEIGGICAGVALIVIGSVVFALWVCKRRRRVQNAIGFGDPSILGYDLQPYPLSSTERPDVFDPYGIGRSGEAESRFTRASAFNKAGAGSNVINTSGREQIDGIVLSAPAPSVAPERAVTTPARPLTPKASHLRPDHSRPDAALDDSTRFDRSRADVSTPELQSSPKFAQTARFPGLPRIVEISSNRRGTQRTYLPYRPGVQASGSRDAVSSGIRADLNATEEERSTQQHATSWSQYEDSRRH